MGRTFVEGINVGTPGREITFTLEKGLDFTKAALGSHGLDFSGTTLPYNANAIRGASVAPKRASGWISFSGTVTTEPAAVYTDYRELHAAGTAEVLGIGSFPFMDSGSSCKSLFALQAICEVDAGATVLSAAGDPAVGIFPIFAKCLLNGETFTAGGVAAAAFLSVQANVTDVQAEDTSIINAEVASGGIQNILKFQCSAAKGATYLLNITDDNGEPASLTNGSTLNDIHGTANAGWIRVKVAAGVRYIPLYEAKA